MADPLIIDGFVDAFLEQAPDGERDVVAIGVLSAAAAHLTLLVGARAASAAIYAIADKAATQHLADLGR